MSGNSMRILLASAFLAAIAGCGFKAADSPQGSVAKAPADPPAAEGLDQAGGAARTQAVATAAAPAPGPAGSPSSGGLAAVFASRKLIRSALATVEVADFERAAQEVSRVAASLGGYVADAQATRGQQDRQSGTVTIRVPAEQFAAAMGALKGLGKVRSESVSTQDVTREYADLETRLRVKRDTADRLRGLLRARTRDLGDVLSVERELARVTEEIERMEGERRFYDSQVAFSTIALTLVEPQALVEPGVFSPITDALRDSVSVLAQSLAAIVYLAVFLAPWSLVAFAAWRVFRAVRARRKAAA